ncbi:hypothetical protein AJ79_04122 [Helicocarpus griseus UAMH5409]|uniref:Urease accessory protein UreD n=1 Tax=Helicocarpus griseus UAMH5409 TaxID=1447875 RepID=A0A2B7XLJ7_9EURO|nr:hypothetical protein AJ79_04122 [Helicocarpus griseus UAMH5409]
MPHKHKRRGKDNSDSFDLPPTKIAKPLPPKPASTDSKEAANKKRKLKKPAQDSYKDDTPKAFLRMMQQFQKASSGARVTTHLEDDGTTKPNKKRRRGEQQNAANTGTSNGTKRADSTQKPAQKSTSTTTPSQQPPALSSSSIPKILPGERMSDFAARVDQALPLSGISRKSGTAGSLGKDPALKNLREHRVTKHEKRLLRLQREWREEEAKIREKEEAEREEREAEKEEVNEQWKAWELEAGVTKKKKKAAAKSKKKGKKKGKGGAVSGGDGSEDDDLEDDDPWRKLNEKAKAQQRINPLEVVQAPPTQLIKPKPKFKERGMGGAVVNVANVPAAAGSLRVREELAEERLNFLEQYRKLTAERRV